MTFSPEIVERFTQGDCHLLAITLARLTDLPIGVVGYKTLDGDVGWSHAVVVLDDTYDYALDVKGKQHVVEDLLNGPFGDDSADELSNYARKHDYWDGEVELYLMTEAELLRSAGLPADWMPDQQTRDTARALIKEVS